MMVKIYELRDPRDESKSPRYVGITTKRKLYKRLYCHLWSAKNEKTKSYKNNWINSLLKDGIKPTIHLIEEVEGWDYACEVEKYWIKEFKDQGYKLTNSTEGGDGTVGYSRKGYKMSEETKIKIGLANKGKKRSKEVVLALALQATGKKQSKETIHKRMIKTKKQVLLEYETGEIVKYSSYNECINALNINCNTLTLAVKLGYNKRLKFKIKRIFNEESVDI